MDFQDLIYHRQSVRRFDKTKKISKEQIERILEAGRMAPSACNSQPWTFVVVNENPLVEEISKATYNTLINFNKFVQSASIHIVLVLEKPKVIAQIGGSIKNKEYPLIDIGIAAEHLCLQAAEDGIGSCMLGWFDEKKIKKLLQIPNQKSIALVIPMGYAIENYPLRKKSRKSMGEIARWNNYSSKSHSK